MLVPGLEISTEDSQVLPYAVDSWPLTLKWTDEEIGEHTPAGVVRVHDASDLPRLMHWANAERVSIVPVAGRSSVTGASIPGSTGMLSVDLAPLNHILKFDDVSGYVTVEAGVVGGELESYLNGRGFTLGHYPQSLSISTVGGWIGTLSSGTYSAKYGGIERLLKGCDVVLPNGSEISLKAQPRSAGGPWLPALMLGAEGSMCIVTRATLQSRRIPEATAFQTYALPDIHVGLDLAKAMFDRHCEPALLRLYDSTESSHLYASIGLDRCEPLLLVGHQGERRIVETSQEVVSGIAASNRAISLGPEIAETWSRGRYRADWIERGNSADNLLADSIEIAATWNVLETIYDDVMAVIRPFCREAMAHWSHFYPDGSGMYVIFELENSDRDQLISDYERVWDHVLTVSAQHGGTLSHHHGIGLVRAERLRIELGTSYDLLEKVKAAIDPNGIMNPGKLGLPGNTDSAR